MRTYEKTIATMERVAIVVDRLTKKSVWFSFLPLPDDLYEVSVKAENKHVLDDLVDAVHKRHPLDQGAFTVEIAGPERHDGEAPYLYVINAADEASAVAECLRHHRHSQYGENPKGDDAELAADCIVVESFAGLPGGLAGYWNDLRPVVK